MQLALLLLFIFDSIIVWAQCEYGLEFRSTKDGHIEIVTTNKVWFGIRIGLGCIRWALYLGLIFMSFFVLHHIRRALNSDPNYQPLKRQVYSFFYIFIT